METHRLVLIGISAVSLAWGLRAACGRLTGKVAFAPLLFLVSRWPVLVGWVLGAVAMYVLMSTSAAGNGKHPSILMLMGVSLFSGLGFSAMVVGPLFMISRVFATAPQLDLLHTESVEATHLANHMLNNEGRGGKLMITNERLLFQPHRFNIQLDPWSVRLEQIRGVTSEGMRLVLIDTDERQEILVAQAPERLVARIREKLGARGNPAESV